LSALVSGRIIDPKSFFDAVVQVLDFVLGSGATATLSAGGLILLSLASVLADVGQHSKPEERSDSLKWALFLYLIFDVIFSSAGPTSALFYVLKAQYVHKRSTNHSMKHHLK
jgi:hypothetical protein